MIVSKHGHLKGLTSVFLLSRDRVRRPTSVFDRGGFDPFARNRRASLSKKTKLKLPKQQAPSLVKQPDYSQGAGIPDWLVHEDWALLQVQSSVIKGKLLLLIDYQLWVSTIWRNCQVIFWGLKFDYQFFFFCRYSNGV